VDPRRDRETIETELALADLANVKKRREKVEGKARTGDKQGILELAALQKIEAALQEGKPASSLTLSPEETEVANQFQLLTQKPVIYALNASEEQLKTLTPQAAKEQLSLPSSADLVIICAKIEEDLQELTADEAQEFMKELAITSSGLDQLIRAAYHALGYITFFTAGPEEVRAWTVTKGATAPVAAGVIHTDFQKGFICAETIAYEDYVGAGSEQKAKETGKMRTEGKEYVVKDGDVFHFRFNV
jgi:GTP-binding protein YchF